MYCPNCGFENNRQQNFCRFCGFNLAETAKSLKLQRAFGERAFKLKKSDKIKRISNRISDYLLTGFIIGLIGVFLIDAGKTTQFLKFSIAVYIIFQIGLWFMNHFQKVETKRYLAGEIVANDFANREIESKETRRLLDDKPFEAVPTIAENSTELLFVENKTRKFE